MSRAGHLMRLLALACLASAALGSITPPTKAILNVLTNQRNITNLTGELNPYGLVLIPNNLSQKNKGALVPGNFLTTQWNDPNGNPGQGKTILQVTPQGVATPFATVDVNNATVQQECGTAGVGLTMAIVILTKGFVVVGSTPIAVGGTVAGTGCLLVFNSNGVLLDAHAAQEKTSATGVMTGGGPWAMAVEEYNGGSNANLYVSYVLGTCPSCTETLMGDQGGKVVRYQLQVPGGPFNPNFWGNAPDIIVSGFPTQPGNIGGGAVGPTGLLVGTKNNGYPDQLANRLFIANNLNNSVGVVQNPGGCFSWPGADPPCVNETVAWNGLIMGPIGLAQSNFGTIVGANGLIGTLFEIAPTVGANTQLAVQLVDNLNAGPTTVAGAGTLFNVLFLNASTLVFNDDGLNSYNTLTATPCGAGRRRLH